MTRGTLLLHVARNLCSAERCANVVEPAIADLQHDPRRGGSLAVVISLADSLLRDALAPASLAFLGSAAAAFAAVIAASALVEVAVMHSRVRAWLPSFPYVGWYALSSSATLVWMVPLAIAPALLYGRRRAAPSPGIARFTAAALGVCLSIAATGWIAPAIERADIMRQYDEFQAATHGRYAVTPVAVTIDRSSTAKSLTSLIRAAFSPPAHRFPGYPNYVAPEDQLHDVFWRDLRFRGLMMLLACASAVVGLRAQSLAWTIARTPRLFIS